MNKRRKYSEDYVCFGFTRIIEDGTEKPQCFLCGKVMSNCSLRPVKLKKHFSSSHPDHALDRKDILEAAKAGFENGKHSQNVCSTEKLLLHTSYKIAYQIAKQKKPHIIGETLIKPCILETIRIISGEREMEKYEKIPLSNNVIKSRIQDISNNILKQVIHEIKDSPYKFSMQLDETTDISQCCQLLVFVRYVHNNSIKEEFLFCEKLLETSKATDVLRVVDNFFVREGIDWKKKICNLCTDGAPAMMGNTSGFTTLVKREVPGITVQHCLLHKHALAAKTLPPYLAKILSTSVKVINFIRSRALNHRLFESFCEALGSEYKVLLYHTEVRWLSRGRILNRLLKLRLEVLIFLTEKGNDLAKDLEDVDFVHGLAYLADIFQHMNDINLSMQGRAIFVMDAAESLQAWLNKLPLWRIRVMSDNYVNFQLLHGELHSGRHERGNMPSDFLKAEIIQHLQILETSFNNYFSPESLEVDTWIRTPFICDINVFDDSDMCKDEIIDLRTKQVLQAEFNVKTLGDFWCSLMEKYPNLTNRAIVRLLPFATTYLCESGFSTLVTIKTATRNRIDVQHDMRIALSITTPNLDDLTAFKKQRSARQLL